MSGSGLEFALIVAQEFGFLGNPFLLTVCNCAVSIEKPQTNINSIWWYCTAFILPYILPFSFSICADVKCLGSTNED